MEKIIRYFSERHLLTNIIFIAVIITGILMFSDAKKEEMPDVTFNFVRVSVNYPGAAPEDVEYFVTQPLEEEIRAIEGIREINSTSSIGRCDISIVLERTIPDMKETVNEIRSAVLDVRMPTEVRNAPRVRQWKTSRKAVIDIGIYNTNQILLSTESRQELQRIVRSLEDRLLSRPEISDAGRTGYLRSELVVEADPYLLQKYNLTLNTLMNEISKNSIRQPVGTIEGRREAKVTLGSELDTEAELRDLIIQSGFSGPGVRLGDVAQINRTFADSRNIIKVNGHEALLLRISKSSSEGILKAVDAVHKTVDEFRSGNLSSSPIRVVLLDDESISVRNRMSLIMWNGILGFFLVLIILFFFMDLRSGIWVAMGIPFSFCLTMVIAYFLGYTINNITLAAIIIVMGMIVDDAIVVAENISRLRIEGMHYHEAAVKGTMYMLKPVAGSILTTCVAFIPLFYFQGHFGMFIKFIPPIIFFMLAASLLESFFILPSHLNLGKGVSVGEELKEHWFMKYEKVYSGFLEKALKHRVLIFMGFILLFGLSILLAFTQFQFVMFPRAETTQVRVQAMAPEDSTRFETEKLGRGIEKTLLPYLGKEIIGHRTTVARSRWGGEARENRLNIRIEIQSREERKRSLQTILAEWQSLMTNVQGFDRISINAARWGHGDSSALEIHVRENDDKIRRQVTAAVMAGLEAHPAITNIETDRPLVNPEFRLELKREELKKLGITPSAVATTLRAVVSGQVLYEITENNEEIDLRVTLRSDSRDALDKVLNMPVENRSGYLVPLHRIVKVTKTPTPDSIFRRDLRRTTKVFADIKKKSGRVPLDLAEELESTLFREIYSQWPGTLLTFEGEVRDTRESGNFFTHALLIVIAMIFLILILLFQSVWRPFVILFTIPFGLTGVILAFFIHGMKDFGFFGVIGALGLCGVVVNDAIVMVVKLDREKKKLKQDNFTADKIAKHSATRLRAVILTTLTTVAAVLPTAYGFAGYDAMMAEMMLALAWGLFFATMITLLLVPSLYMIQNDIGTLARRIFPALKSKKTHFKKQEKK